MSKVDSKEVINYSKSAAKSAAKGAAVGAAISSPFIVKQLIDIRKYSKELKNPAIVDTFEKLSKEVPLSETLKEAAANNSAIKQCVDAINAARKLLAKNSQKALESNVVIGLCLTGIGAVTGLLMHHYFKNKHSGNQAETNGAD